MKYEPEDAELLTLLDLNACSFWCDNGYWVKLEACKVDKDKFRPHGINYSLTLHDRNNTRVLGFDNAHAISKKGRRPKKYTGRIITWDHVHKHEKIERYLFSSASQLLDDFWKAVNEIVKG
jgi:hypothetical protein